MKTQTIFQIIILSLLIAGCKENEEPDLFPVLSSNAVLECIHRGELKGDEPSSGKSCLYWSYNEHTLTIKHYNAGFNCCPEAILVNLEVKGDTLVITENDSLELCRCNCLFDLDISIRDLAEGHYTIRMVEPYAPESVAQHVFEVDLSDNASGNHCLNRDFYPWGI